MASGHLSVVPPYVEPRRRTVPHEVSAAMRWICFLIFLVSFAAALPVQYPGSKSVQDLVADIHAGRASSIAVHEPAGEQTSDKQDLIVRWRTGPFTWYEAQETAERDQLIGTLTSAGEQSGHPISVGSYTRHRIAFYPTPDVGVWTPLPIVAGLIWLATFIGMLAVAGHPYATRWAWFWLFILGGVGPLLFFWKEPVPLRFRFWRRDDGFRWTQAPISGGIGFAYGIGWVVVICVAGAFCAWLGSN